ncbi:hypothetical protein [Burkholderia gladioli]|uniref:hypothetical protein n=1 Tax=Burkholderia gladioli TaxID=28095 RepID=UPI001916FD00|nr:hypothetical protein [Burkholderia gladioli]
MNEIDALKQLRLQEEVRYVHVDHVEDWSRIVLDGLVRWSNATIFSTIGGELSIDLPLGPPNAGVGYLSHDPLRPQMMIRQSMVTDIYRDAFAFPLISRRIASETNTLDGLHRSPLFNNLPFLFSTGIPALDANFVLAPLRPICEAMVKAHQEQKDSPLAPSDLYCRFIMFELMLVWTFFHELGHVVQRHFRLRSDPYRADGADAFLEFDERGASYDLADMASAQPVVPDLRAQARELMADAEALDLTLKYLLATGRLKFPMSYLLLCSISCMFQRFYLGYADDLTIAPRQHPHPALRDEVSQSFLARSLCDYLAGTEQTPDREAAAITITYLSVRASLFTGLFRSHRIEQRDDPSTLPSYMRLQGQAHGGDMSGYLRALMPHIDEQMSEVLQWHLLPDHRLDHWQQVLKVRAKE